MVRHEVKGRSLCHPRAIEHRNVQRVKINVIVHQRVDIFPIACIPYLSADCSAINHPIHHLIEVVRIAAPCLPDGANVDIGPIKVSIFVGPEVPWIIGHIIGGQAELSRLPCQEVHTQELRDRSIADPGSIEPEIQHASGIPRLTTDSNEIRILT